MDALKDVAGALEAGEDDDGDEEDGEGEEEEAGENEGDGKMVAGEVSIPPPDCVWVRFQPCPPAPPHRGRGGLLRKKGCFFFGSAGGVAQLCDP